MGCPVPLSGLRVTQRSEVIGRFHRKLLILWDEEPVTGVQTREDVAQRNRCATLVHIEQSRGVALPTRVRALSPNCPSLGPRIEIAPEDHWMWR